MFDNPLIEQLKAPFPKADTEFRISRLIKGSKKGYALAYITARAVMERLDAVFGITGWKDEYEVLKDGVICRLSIKIDDAWIGRQDAAPWTMIEPIKGGFSDAFKRAAVKFGIGRYLYHLPEYTVTLTPEKPHNADPQTIHYHWSQAVSGWWVEPELPDWAVSDEARPVASPHSLTLEKGELIGLVHELHSRGAVTDKKKQDWLDTLSDANTNRGLIAYIATQLRLIDRLYNRMESGSIDTDEGKKLYRKILYAKMPVLLELEKSLSAKEAA